eukprot:1595430-Pyramimonas_sp.AAC.1
MRAAVWSISNSARRGALRALWASACWPPVRLFAINKRGDDKCVVCKNAVGTYAHQWFARACCRSATNMTIVPSLQRSSNV